MQVVLLYIQDPVTYADLVTAGREFAALHHVDAQELSPEYRQINLVSAELRDGLQPY